MKKIISTLLVFGISIFANLLFAQQISREQKVAFQTDNIETLKKSFAKEDYNKCFGAKETSYNLLSFSVKHDKKNVFNYLLSNNVDVNKACDNQTPLMIAAKYGRADLAKALLKKGATKTLKNDKGQTAKDYSVEYKQPALTEILK
ncbi:ankyrin repeat domain-containing protein [Chryseobacterium glaciei]|uniref:Uncharacterized protein n=1 Tax=Chryseobacterium glaciei TaxID=1685010 RepID=A0A172XWA1_9FLAO|nr:ankyrin repeat domain-containing protein [Chryseobacterium glaciei]ANF51140.1 hypothetical protein A0O34_11715 [Chryseobacterium glaciei]